MAGVPEDRLFALETWQQGVDVLHLQAREALRSGSGASFDPTKNACPQWRTDVHFMPY